MNNTIKYLRQIADHIRDVAAQVLALDRADGHRQATFRARGCGGAIVSGGDLARRAVACPGWRWMPGMREAGDGATVLDVSDGGWLTTAVYVGDADGWSVGWRIAANASPDLADPATLGCLLALVREAWGAEPDIESSLHVKVVVWTGAGWKDFVEATLAEALVAALEAAPRREVSP